MNTALRPTRAVLAVLLAAVLLPRSGQVGFSTLTMDAGTTVTLAES